MTRVKRTCMAFCFATLTLFSSTAVANASSVDPQESCRILIEKIPGQPGKSREVSRVCSSDEEALMRRPALGTKLVTFYAGVNYGTPFRQVEGDDGPCDGEGYGLPELENLNDDIGGVSSYIISNDCNDQIYYYEEDYEGDRTSNLNDCTWVGEPWNDHLYSMALWHS